MIRIRKEKLRDIRVIHEVNRLAFGQPQEANLVDKLRMNCKDILSLVALADDQLVGCILFSPVKIESNDVMVKGAGLAPVAVLPDYQRQGIGSKMIRDGIARLIKRGFPFIIVLGHPDYYPRFGFEPASRHRIKCEWEAPDEAFMILILDRSRMEVISGTAKYRPEFAEVT